VVDLRNRSRIIMSWLSAKTLLLLLSGARGGKIGGKARAANMTQEQRTESARNAVLARWKAG